jgi:hypothetical protein
MYRKTFAIHLFSIALAAAFLVGSFPMSNHMASMAMNQKMVSKMAAAQANLAPGNVNKTSESCCDVICPFSIFLAPQTAYAVLYGDNKQVVNSNPVIELIYIESIAPPPKA